MKLVVTYMHGDGYTWWADETVPIEYESEEHLLCDLEEFVESYLSGSNCNEFKNTEICASDLIENGKYYAPTVRTLEQWWDDEVGQV